MIQVKDKTQCVGCYACVNICHKHCIHMEQDQEGFYYPEVDESQCNNCHQCEKVCPIQNFVKAKKYIRSFACKSLDDEIRRHSSSGGIFSVIATDILAQNGVVYGAAYYHQSQVVHQRIDRVEDLVLLQGSKYIQSQIGTTYQQVKMDLEQKNKVLFTGTPCQIAGLKQFLRKEYSQLFTIDILCHGVPSNKVWSKYLKDLGVEQVEDIQFRNKDTGWTHYSVQIIHDNAKVFRQLSGKNDYIRGFISDIFLRPSCYDCRFKENNNVSDMTIGDFWGAEEYVPQIFDDQGISVVIIRSKQGEDMFHRIKTHIQLESVSLNQAISKNTIAFFGAGMHPNREMFFQQLHQMKFHKLIQKYVKGSIRNRILRRVCNKATVLMKKVRGYLHFWKHDVIYYLYYRTKNYFIRICSPKVKVASIEETIEQVRKNHLSVSRYGDGELLWMLGEKQHSFQENSLEMKLRLIEIIKSESNQHIVCLSDAFGSLGEYNHFAKCFWSKFMVVYRKKWIELLNINKTYYNTNMTRLYMDYKDKSKSYNRFHLIQHLWEERDLIIIEGVKTRLGVGNDLFDSARSVRRILAPATNAYAKYDAIYQQAILQKKDVLFLLALGPTATILAWDLSVVGYQAIDVGHIDIEYEWFRMKAKKKVPVTNKYVNEAALSGGANVGTIEDKSYHSEIIAQIV